MFEPVNNLNQGNNPNGNDQLELTRKIMRENAKDVISKVLARDYAYVKSEERDKVAAQVMSAPRDSKINIGGEDVSIDKFQNELGNSILEFELAESIERINCGTTTEEEYFDWIDEQRTIIAKCNDGECTQDDFNEKEAFIGVFHQREIELLTCIALFENNRCEGAPAKCAYLKQKLLKLREIRSAVKASTPNEPDKKITREEYEKAVEYRKLLREMKEAEISKSQNTWTSEMEKNLTHSKVHMGVYHGGDADLNTSGFFYSAMVTSIVLQNDGYCYHMPCTNSPAERLSAVRNRHETLDDVRNRLEMLSGRKPPLKDLPAYDYNKIRERMFTRDGFNQAFDRSENTR